MQESKLMINASATMSGSQEWEDVADTWGAAVGADAASGVPLDWAATGNEGDKLPDLGGIQGMYNGMTATLKYSHIPCGYFDGSGSATPVAQPGTTGPARYELDTRVASCKLWK
ncbi:hypothetical protein FRC11_005386 [Ceratobasidium sp. 423]|nr:hypothetical protein FRC11_005386 [Ceratobasidium sp. 423]